MSGKEITQEELHEFIIRLGSNEPHIRCRLGDGPLAPLAVALNDLAALLETRRLSAAEKFGIEALVEQSRNMMLTFDTMGRLRFVNFTIPGVTREQVLGRSAYDFVIPSEHERVRGIIQGVLTTGEPAVYEILSGHATGPEWFVVQVGPIRDAGHIVGFTMITTDVTNLKRTQIQLEQSLRELERSNHELEFFATIASHDLHEPLRKVQFYSDRLSSEGEPELSPERRSYVERIQHAATRMRKLINDVLTFARVTSKAKPFVRVELDAIVRDVLSDLEVAIGQAGATVTVGELPKLEADPSQMQQLFQNLLSNALKFRREGVAPRISIGASVDKNARLLELWIQDNGVGFSEKYQDQIFNPFQRLHGRHKYDGTGLGLTMCRKIVERHGGSIGARSSPGNGARFTVKLPLKYLE
jgi:PAS domain S-box-containing protein